MADCGASLPHKWYLRRIGRVSAPGGTLTVVHMVVGTCAADTAARRDTAVRTNP